MTPEEAWPPPPKSGANGFVVEPIGHVESPILDPEAAPLQADEGAPPATLVLHPRVQPGIRDLKVGDRIVVLTWLHRARRDELLTHPRGDPDRPLRGVFSTRSPHRPNPIGLHSTRVVAVEGGRIVVEQLEVIDGTPVLDIKPTLGPPDRR